MEFSFKRVNALFKKEVKDLSKNMNVLCMCLLPLVFCTVYSKVFDKEIAGEGIGSFEILILCVGMNLTLVSSFVIAMLIAEEKEKSTLRTLMLSAVSPWEFLAGKAIVTILLSIIVNIAMFFIVGVNINYLGMYALITILVVLSMVAIGAVIGIISQNQMATGVVGMPVLMVFLLLPVFARFNEGLKTIAEFLPNYNMNLLLRRLFTGQAIGSESIRNIAIILAWILIAAAAFAYTYKKKGLDS